MKQRHQQSGFTLIELLLYVTIFATLIGAVVALAVLASSQKVNSQLTADINYQGEATMAYITQTIRQASSITAPSPANTSNPTLTRPLAYNNCSFGIFHFAAPAANQQQKLSFRLQCIGPPWRRYAV